MENFLQTFKSTCLILISGFFIGALSERLAVKSYFRIVINAKNWNTLVKFVTSLVVTYVLLDTDNTTITVDDEIDLWGNYTTTSLLFFYIIIRVALFAFGAHFGSAIQPIGLTGGIACGKSTVSSILREGSKEGKDKFEIIDVDKIAHNVLDPYKLGSDSAYPKLVKAFGKQILEEETDEIFNTTIKKKLPKINRRILGDIIFKDRSKRKILNGITHPLIIKIMIKNIVSKTLFLRSNKSNSNNSGASSSSSGLCLVDIPLLFEGGFFMKILFGLKITVLCSDPSLQLSRLSKRNPDLTPLQCEERIASQMPLALKVKMSDMVLRNDGDLEDLQAQVDIARQEVLNRVKARDLTLSRMVLWNALIVVIFKISTF